uniref:universal stress protein n=1 Tax=Halegenticoccus soli TaxID=1985678 RepID=UPI000C6EFFF2|nr:universal stress protein [Halegenticoccus soli]
MYESILLPTDGGREMETVVTQGLELAELCAATVHTLHVVDERAYLTIPDEMRDQLRETLEEDGHMATKAVAERALNAGLSVVREVRRGDPSAAILAYAVDNDIELIVMGTHGRTGYERYLLGSVAEKVVRCSPIPVLTVAVGDVDVIKTDIQAGLCRDLKGVETDTGPRNQTDD